MSDFFSNVIIPCLRGVRREGAGEICGSEGKICSGTSSKICMEWILSLKKESNTFSLPKQETQAAVVSGCREIERHTLQC